MPKTTGRNKEQSWYSRFEILIPIVISIISLVYSMYNGYLTEHLRRDVYVPKLGAKYDLADSNSILIDIYNSGLAAAQNIVVEISWIWIDLTNCVTEPPYQDLQPITPLVEHNLSYRLSGLPIEGEFTIKCQLKATSTNILGVSEVGILDTGETTNLIVKIFSDNTKSTGEFFLLPIVSLPNNP